MFIQSQPEKRFQNAFAGSGEISAAENDYFLIFDTNLTIVSYNASAATLLKESSLPAKENDNTGSFLSITETESFYQMASAALSGISGKLEINFKREENTFIRFTISPYYNSNGSIAGVTCIGYDIRKEKAQEEKLKAQHSVLQEIAQVYSHQVRHPLTNIMAIIDVIKSGDAEMTKTFLPFLETASKELDHVIRTVVLASAAAA